MWYEEINFMSIISAMVSFVISFYIYDSKIQAKFENKIDKMEFLREIEKIYNKFDRRDNEVKNMIKELKSDINKRLDDIKEDINYIRDRK